MKRTKRYAFIAAFLVATVPLVGFMLGGWFLLMPYLVIFALIPFIDFFWIDEVNPDEPEARELAFDPWFKWLCMAYVPYFLFLTVTSIHHVSSASWAAIFSHLFISGVVAGGIAITVAHELMHKSTPEEQWGSRILLAWVCYGHFVIEHVRGHHVRVATPEDPASGRYGESLYAFWLRSLFGGMRSAWQLESQRLSRLQLPLWHWRNEFYWIVLVPVTIAILAFLYAGLAGVFFFIGQGVVAFMTLEVVNYIEHYGLVRQKLANGQYEPFGSQHAWNSPHAFSNLSLFQLQRHPDHHARAAVRYQNLRHMPESPQLPTGYPGMYLLAMVPPLWRKVMHKRIADFHQNKMQS